MKIFDCHLHIINPKYPLIENQGFIPKPFTVDDYKNRMKDLQVIGGAVVSSSFQEFDHKYLRNALQTLGNRFVGVTQLPYHTSDNEILKLHTLGVRAIRFNVKRGGSEDISKLDYLARKVYELVKWHTELYIDAKSLTEIRSIIEKLPAVTIDHLGLSRVGLENMLYLVNRGLRVKATGFGRIDFDAGKVMRLIYEINPDALMFGTDLPSTRANRPFQEADIELILDTFTEKESEKILYKNALHWYRIN